MSDQIENKESQDELINKKHIIATVAIWACIAIFAWVMFSPKKLELKALSLLPEPKAVNLDVANMNFTSDFNPQGGFILIFFGFTHCPDVCPTEMQKLAQVIKTFEEEKLMLEPLVVFIDVDPERDDLPTIKKYVRYFSPKIIGLAGTNKELAETAAIFSAPYSRSVTIDGKEYLVEAGADMPPNSGNEYSVNHSSRIYVVDPSGQYIGSFPPPHDPTVIVADIKELMSQ